MAGPEYILYSNTWFFFSITEHGEFFRLRLGLVPDKKNKYRFQTQWMKPRPAQFR